VNRRWHTTRNQSGGQKNETKIFSAGNAKMCLAALNPPERCLKRFDELFGKKKEKNKFVNNFFSFIYDAFAFLFLFSLFFRLSMFAFNMAV